MAMHVKLIRHPDSEGNGNRGFTQDALELLVDGLPAGYLKISYVPFHRVIQWTGIDAAHAAIEYQAAACGISEDELLALGKPLGMPPVISHKRLQKAWYNLDGRGELKAGSVYFHVDRPIVDYIRIYQLGDSFNRVPHLKFRNEHGGRRHIEHDYRGKGFGTLLYAEGAKWMAERSLLLHASGIQTSEAVKVWEGMHRRFGHAISSFPDLPNSRDKKPVRTVLDGNLLKDWYPDNMTIEHEERHSGIPQDCLNYEDLSEDRVKLTKIYEAELLAQNIDFIGGEPFPSSPREALARWEESNQPAFISRP